MIDDDDDHNGDEEESDGLFLLCLIAFCILLFVY